MQNVEPGSSFEDEPPTLVASPPVELSTPPMTGDDSPSDPYVPTLSPTDPWEKVDPWTSLTAYEEADRCARADEDMGPTPTPVACAPDARAAHPATASPAALPAVSTQPTDLEPLLLNLFNTLSNQMGVLNNSVQAQAGVIAKDVEVKLTAQEKKIDAKFAVQKKELSAKIDETNTTVNDLTRRILLLEKRDPTAASGPAREDAAPRPRPRTATRTPGPAGRRLAFSRTRARPGTSFPSCVLLKGWCRFGESSALSKADALGLAARARARLSPGTAALISDTEAGYLLNRQITFKIAGKENCWLVRNELAISFKDDPLRVNDRDVYAVVEPSPTARAKNRVVGSSLRTLEDAVADFPNRNCIVTDFRAGCTYFRADEAQDVSLYVLLGRTHPKIQWQWDEKNLAHSFPELDIKRLTDDTASILND